MEFITDHTDKRRTKSHFLAYYMPSNLLKKPPLQPYLTADDFSNPSGSTNKALTINKLAPFTDKLRTKMNYKKPEIYDAGGDITKQWFVYYSCLDPETGKFKRIKVFKDINTYNTKAERYEIARYHQHIYLIWLQGGGSWFDESNKQKTLEDQNIIVCLDKFIQYIQDSKLRKNTRRKYELEMNVFKRWLESEGKTHLLIGEIKKQTIFEFIEYIKKRSKVTSGKTVNHYLNDLRRFFNHYIDNYDDYLERNPATKITRDIVESRGNIAYTDDEFEAIKKHISETDEYLWFVCQVIYYTGLRNEAEALELRCGDFDFKNKLFFVDAWVAKNKIRQPVPIYPEFEELLLSLNLQQYPADWYLFGRRDKPGPVRVGTDNFARRFRPVKKHFGLGDDYGLYAFKSTRACHLFDDGAVIREIQLLFRHATPLITMEYLKSLGRVERGRILDKGRKV